MKRRNSCVVPALVIGISLTLSTGELSADKETRTSHAATGEQIKWQVLSSGGGPGISTNFKMDGTAGQTAIGLGTSTNFKISQGYWQSFTTSCCVGTRGNVNGVGGVTVADLTYLVAFLFGGGPPSLCPDEANMNGVGGITVADLTFLVNFLFNSGPTPPACP